MKMRSCFLFLSIAAAAVFSVPRAQAQAHFQSCVSGTGSNATVVIPATINPTIGGDAVAVGDEIAVFTPGGICAGVTVWDGTNTSITVWGDDEITTEVEGFTAGDSLHFRVWDASASAEYGDAVGAVEVTYSSAEIYYRTDGLYGDNAIYALSSLIVMLPPAAPTLSAPADAASGVGTTGELTWLAVSGADTYEVEVASTSDFTTLTASQTGLTTTSYTVSGLETNRTYYWRVRAVNTGGSSPYSTVWSFSTAALQQVQLQQGWNLASSYIAPADSSMEVVFAAIVGNIVLVKDEAGNVYSPEFGINEIGKWNPQEGYAVYASTADTLEMAGDVLPPETQNIALAAGWNMIPFLPSTPLAVDQALASIQTELVLVKDGAGNTYMPGYGIDDIGDMQPGRGYQVYVQAAATLTYPSEADLASL